MNKFFCYHQTIPIICHQKRFQINFERKNMTFFEFAPLYIEALLLLIFFENKVPMKR